MAMLRICRHHFRKVFFSKRTLFAAIIAGTLVHLFSSPFRDLCQSSNLKATLLPLFTLIGDNYMASGLLFCIFIWLTSGVPYKDSSYNLIIVRSDFKSWCGGTIAYLILMSLVYWLYVLIVSIVVMLPYLEFSLQWGDFYMALNRGAGNSMIGLFFTFSKKTQTLLCASQALAISFSLHVLLSILLGLVQFMMNLRNGRVPGNVIALAIVLFDFCFQGLGMPYFVYYFSPVSLCCVDLLDFTGTTPYPSVAYAYGLLLVSNGLLGVGISWSKGVQQLLRRRIRIWKS